MVQLSKSTLLSIVSMAQTGYRRNSKRSASTLKIETSNKFHTIIVFIPRRLISCFSGDPRMLQSPISPSVLLDPLFLDSDSPTLVLQSSFSLCLRVALSPILQPLDQRPGYVK